MKNLKSWILCTGACFLRLHFVAADDALAMLQNSLRVNEESKEVEQPKFQERGVPDMQTISRLEELVMAKVHEGVGGNNNLTATINASITSMRKALLAATASNQKLIIDDIKAFKLCKAKMWKKYDKAVPEEGAFWVLGEIYPKCIDAESKLNVVKTRNYKVWKASKSTLKTKQKIFKAVGRACVNVCNRNKNENYNEQLSRLSKYYVDCRKKIGPKYKEVVAAKKKYKSSDKEKTLSNLKYIAMKKKCELIAYRMNQKKCRAVDILSGSCSFYNECWKRSKRRYDSDKKKIMVEEANMKIQWRALTRIQCFLQVLNIKNDKNHKKEKAQLNKCIGIKVKVNSKKTKPLNIDYKRVPKKPKCPEDPWCPCTAAYLNFYYRKGPKSRCVKNVVKKYKCAACKKRRR